MRRLCCGDRGIGGGAGRVGGHGAGGLPSSLRGGGRHFPEGALGHQDDQGIGDNQQQERRPGLAQHGPPDASHHLLYPERCHQQQLQPSRVASLEKEPAGLRGEPDVNHQQNQPPHVGENKAKLPGPSIHPEVEHRGQSENCQDPKRKRLPAVTRSKP